MFQKALDYFKIAEKIFLPTEFQNYKMSKEDIKANYKKLPLDIASIWNK